MSSVGRFRVSFHVSHPIFTAERIISTIALQPRYARSAGASRITKQGKDLGGIYAKTDISFAVSDRVLSVDDVLLSEFVDQAMDRLALKEIDQIVSSGGFCFFLIGIYSEGNFLCDFDTRLLSRLASHGIGMKLDFYGGPENDVCEQ
jgi:hypothetical protein